MSERLHFTFFSSLVGNHHSSQEVSKASQRGCVYPSVRISPWFRQHRTKTRNVTLQQCVCVFVCLSHVDAYTLTWPPLKPRRRPLGTTKTPPCCPLTGTPPHLQHHQEPSSPWRPLASPCHTSLAFLECRHPDGITRFVTFWDGFLTRHNAFEIRPN